MNEDANHIYTYNISETLTMQDFINSMNFGSNLRLVIINWLSTRMIKALNIK